MLSVWRVPRSPVVRTLYPHCYFVKQKKKTRNLIYLLSNNVIGVACTEKPCSENIVPRLCVQCVIYIVTEAISLKKEWTFIQKKNSTEGFISINDRGYWIL